MRSSTKMRKSSPSGFHYAKQQRVQRSMEPTTFENGQYESIITEILTRLDRVERRLQCLEHDKLYGSERSLKVKSKEHTLQNISIIGLKEALTAKRFSVRVTWILCFVLCFTATGYFVFKTFHEYLNEPTATKVKMDEQKTYTYPQILLCPEHWLDAEKALKDGLSIDGLQYALGYLINYYVNPPPFRIHDYEAAEREFLNYYHARGFGNLVDFFKSVALDSDEFFYQCPYCLNKTFEKVLMSESICYNISMHATPGKAPVVMLSSLDKIEVSVPDKTLGLLSKQTYWRLFLGVDLRVAESTRRYAEIYPGQANTVQFVTHKFVTVPKPKSPCRITNTGDSSETDVSNENYSYAKCVVECFVEPSGQLFMMTACSYDWCDNSQITPNRTFRFYREAIWDELAFLQENNQQKGDEVPPHCYDRCPAACERTIYTMDVQSHPLSESDINLPNAKLPRNVSATKMHGRAKNLTRIYFMNSAAVYGGVLTFREVSTYSFETMVGNVGGMLSLWMGMSVISLVQIFMFFVSDYIPYKRKRNARKYGSAHLLEQASTV